MFCRWRPGRARYGSNPGALCESEQRREEERTMMMQEKYIEYGRWLERRPAFWDGFMWGALTAVLVAVSALWLLFSR